MFEQIETEEEFSFLLNWLEEAQLDRVGCFQYENVEGAKSNQLSNQVPNDIKQDRWERFMSKANEISCSKLERKVGTKVEVIVDQIDEDAAICRTKADAPEIDGNLFIDKNFSHLNPGDLLTVKVDEASDYDLWGAEVG